MPRQLLEICGDVTLSPADQWRYVFYGLRQIVGSIGQRCSLEAARTDFGNDDVQSRIDEGASPLRVYTSSLAAQVIQEHLSESGPICDIGCGSGRHSRLFEEQKGSHLYVGIDMAFHPSWVSAATRTSLLPRCFIQTTAEDIGLATGSVAFTFSSSSLEHIPDVQRAVGELARVMRQGAYGLHIVPGVWALFLYLFHGYRRFSPQNLADLFQQAGLKVEQLWSLGGLPSFLLHAVWITVLETLMVRRILRLNPSFRTGRALRVYAKLLRVALRLDPFIPFASAGYAVLVRKS